LIWAAYSGHSRIVLELIDNGADPNLRNKVCIELNSSLVLKISAFLAKLTRLDLKFDLEWLERVDVGHTQSAFGNNQHIDWRKGWLAFEKQGFRRWIFYLFILLSGNHNVNAKFLFWKIIFIFVSAIIFCS